MPASNFDIACREATQLRYLFLPGVCALDLSEDERTRILHEMIGAELLSGRAAASEVLARARNMDRYLDPSDERAAWAVGAQSYEVTAHDL